MGIIGALVFAFIFFGAFAVNITMLTFASMVLYWVYDRDSFVLDVLFWKQIYEARISHTRG